MTYQIPSDNRFLLRASPASSSRFDWLWPNPVKAGCYGRAWGETLVVTINHAKAVQTLSQIQPDRVILALECGGFGAEAAAAFGLLTRQRLQTELGQLFARRNFEQVELALDVQTALRMETHVLGDSKEALEQMKPLEASFWGNVPHQLRNLSLRGYYITGLLLGQILLFSLPLLIFGWRTWMVVIIALGVAAYGLAALWPIFSIQALSKGALFSIWFAFPVFIFAYALYNNAVPLALNFTIVFVLCSLWMSAILAGIRT